MHDRWHNLLANAAMPDSDVSPAYASILKELSSLEAVKTARQPPRTPLNRAPTGKVSPPWISWACERECADQWTHFCLIRGKWPVLAGFGRFSLCG